MSAQIDLAVAHLTNKTLQVFAVNSNSHIFTTWKENSDSSGPWSKWSRFPGAVTLIRSGRLRDGRPYLLGIGPDGTLSTNWKVSTLPNDAWSGWTVFEAPTLIDIALVTLVGGSPQLFGIAADHSIQTCWDASSGGTPDWQSWGDFPGELRKITSGRLSDKRPQLFGIAPDGTLLTCWKVSLDTSAAWSDWVEFGGSKFRDITAFELEGGALQLIGVHPFGQLQTCWKTSTSADASWTAWQNLDGSLNGIASGILPDGRAQLFGIWSDGTLSSSMKTSTSSAAAWSGWAPFDPGAAPAAPLSCHFNLESLRIKTTRSRDKDTVFLSASLALGSSAPQTRSQAMGDLNEGLYNLNVSFDNIQMSDADTAVLTFAVVNNGHSDPGIVIKNLQDTTKQLAQKGADAIATAAGGAVGAALGASIGTAAVPIIGTALGALAGFIVDEVGTLLFANCDGAVAAGVHTFTGAQLRDAGFIRQEDYNPGTDSAAGCGSNSEYFVTYTVEAT